MQCSMCSLQSVPSQLHAELRTAGEHDRAPDAAIIASPAKRLLYSLIAGKGDALTPRERRLGLGALVRGEGGGVAPVVQECRRGDTTTTAKELKEAGNALLKTAGPAKGDAPAPAAPSNLDELD